MKTNITIELNPINCGIYEFRHVETGLAYVGSAIDVRTRVAQHFKALSKGKHYNKKAQALYNASPSGNSAFTATLIEACSVEEMDDIEDGYIQSGDYGLNSGSGKYGRKARRTNVPKPKQTVPKVKPPRKTRSDKMSEEERREARRQSVRQCRANKKAKAAEAAA